MRRVEGLPQVIFSEQMFSYRSKPISDGEE